MLSETPNTNPPKLKFIVVFSWNDMFLPMHLTKFFVFIVLDLLVPIKQSTLFLRSNGNIITSGFLSGVKIFSPNPLDGIEINVSMIFFYYFSSSFIFSNLSRSSQSFSHVPSPIHFSLRNFTLEMELTLLSP